MFHVWLDKLSVKNICGQIKFINQIVERIWQNKRLFAM
jgi:hypothetical protein